MLLAKATLIKLQTEDGMFSLHDHIVVGKVYTVDLSSCVVEKGYNVEFKKIWRREVVDIIEEGKVVGYMPTELIDIDHGKEN